LYNLRIFKIHARVIKSSSEIITRAVTLNNDDFEQYDFNLTLGHTSSPSKSCRLCFFL